ncbi:MAG: TetR/AcrR family transcriptional regulator [Fusobacterium necrophorum]|nr:TetR/AcrR family transcriptional regulator [Fusobacterium necrophorum]MCI7681677.1 TetR/AcrR family transcriptional regulator [Fusobacterium necrophorum]MDY2572782.1 TetR/AcrR family transcriptional regulator [Fusobacterium necrophorum]MDY6173015.1 TetR/AcrR family transcriptional regulator [Fusobacterium necrophorum]
MPRKSVYTREMILEAAVEVFKQKGYDNITVKNIAKQLGCSIAPVYAAYTSMEDLKKDVVTKVGDTLITCLDEIPASCDIVESELPITEEQKGLFERMFSVVDPENEKVKQKFENLVEEALQKSENPEESRMCLFNIFMKAISIMSETRHKKFTKSEILSLIARHKNYILTLKKKKGYGNRRK